MRKISKVLVLVLSAIMVLAMSVSVLAADPVTDGKITVTNAIDGEVYTLYKVFDATTTTDHSGASYKADWTVPENNYFNVDDKGNITIKDAGKDPEDHTKLSTGAIDWLKTQISNFTEVGSKTASGGQVEWTNLAEGYYYVNTSTGSFVLIDTIKPDKTIQEKNSLPTGDKKQTDSASGTYADALLELNIGDTVYYQYEITIGKGTDKDIKVTDTMTSGLDLQDTITVQKDGTDLVKDTDYTLTQSEHGFELILKAGYVKTLSENDKVVIQYSAKINSNAVVDSATGNYNGAVLEYSHQTSSPDKVYVATYDFQLHKSNGQEYLPGSGFRLYDAITGGNEIKVNKDSTGYYLDSAGVEIMVDNANGVNVRGLKPGTYYLEETTTPEGYDTLTEREPVTIASSATGPVEVVVVNRVGAVLPTTGGIGTTIFYIVGSLLVIGCGIVLVSRRRMRDK